jgi:UDP-N-acetylglucosamine 4,6-dehydratase/5-epimerase
MINNKINIKINHELKNKTILLTGGAGSIGSMLTKKLLEFPVKSVRILDVDEHALFKLGRSVKDSRLRLLLGDIQNIDRLDMAGVDTDVVIHLAAVKNIEITEFNPIETINTNINGTVNLIKMVMKHKPAKFINISSDKSVDSSTLYGTTKQLGERLTSWAGQHVKTTKFSSVRFGNVMESRGNVFSIWEEEIKNKKSISITEPNMKRYFFHVDEAADFILKCLPLIKEGEIFVPKMKLYKIKDLANQISKKQKIIGLRRGEKIEEILLSKNEKNRAIEKKNFWIIKSPLN